MVVQTEKRLLWHPRHENRFVVGGGSQVTLYEWDSTLFQIKQVTSQLDLNHMKCFAWSPDPTFDDLVAIGMGSGKVDLMRLEATRYSKDHIYSSGRIESLPARSSRSCNALAFSAADPNYLAVGLDKVRNDSSLVIWDLHTVTPLLSLDSSVEAQATSTSRIDPHTMNPRADISSRADQRMIQMQAYQDTVTSIVFLPSSPTQLLAGMSHRWLKLFDMRAPQSSPKTIATKVNGIVTDPLDPYRIACFEEGTVTVWDTRKLEGGLLTFTGRDAGADGARPRAGATFTTVEFSSIRRGTIATLEKEASHVRFWDLQEAEVRESISAERTRSRDSSQSGKVTRSWPNASSILPWGGSVASTSHLSTSNQAVASTSHQIVLSDTRKTKDFNKPLSSFALVPSAEMHPLTSEVMVVNKEGDLELYAVHDTPKLTPWSTRGDLIIGLGCSYRVLPGFTEQKTPPEPWDISILLPTAVPVSKMPSVSRQGVKEKEGAITRDRAGEEVHSPPSLFGRGDEDGFPALSALPLKVATNLAATRPGSSRGRVRTFSPAALRNLHFEHSSSPQKSRVNEPIEPDSHEPRAVDALSINGGRIRRKASGMDHANKTPKLPVPGFAMQHIVGEDISMVMRRRVVQGYGITSPLHNAIVAREISPDDIALSELWRWIHHSQQILSDPTPYLEGYNFAYQGLSGIWESFHSSQLQASTSTHTTPRVVRRHILPNTPVHSLSPLPLESLTRTMSRHSSRRRHGQAANAGLPDDFLLAIIALNERNGIGIGDWKPVANTAKLAQRQLALKVCGWSLAEEDLASAIKRWEKENKHSQAACWLVFTDHFKRAVEVLMRSDDESLHMMSGMLAALIPSTSGHAHKNLDFIEHCERLVVRLQDPYLRAMLTYLTIQDWTEVLQEDALPLRERLAIAFQFLEDKELTSYLRRVTDRCSHDGDIEGLIVTGLTSAGLDILQTYVDLSGDVQTASILASLTHYGAHDKRVERWLDAYRDLLDGWKLFHYRCQFDVERGHILQNAIDNMELLQFEWAPKQILLRCNYCGKPMDLSFSEANNPRATACPHCGRPLPRCSICLMTLAIFPDSARNAALARSNSQVTDTIDDALVFCQTCRHGGHASHILQWFYGEDSQRNHETCPVAGCDCRCADGF
ncbi:WD40 repeat-like protein [Laetiporus sulphureus 93-53]|uniref:WD40 repeat-like protein n=1 Tax=Laetiporus sulphureus 93-53 TaxID=1314785 RepID=A0A165D684_9APHY|nr:WD40 repeat-like protein [Laetiporus sulphureus 93-53]KZT04227.1 WD40 repeat-like protein [Laetiporus sulphureus 93-53]